MTQKCRYTTTLQTSRGKLCSFLPEPAGFTVRPFRMSIGRQDLLLPYPETTALYPIPVRPVRHLPTASFPRYLAITQLPWACSSAHHGLQGTQTPRATKQARRTSSRRGLRSPCLSHHPACLRGTKAVSYGLSRSPFHLPDILTSPSSLNHLKLID